ncbi:hypothetical protein Aasi_1686 [Candidatus Amoebophilus asiaticus 5a2]|uniref:VOC domain-containing protein n=2 Tax=Candidatus Amoebophilus asiaticus TaxID=281120 RepID=C3L3U0_AMOA5|nr:hypothetical protein Aasi_1686 [Candidatus Amoebophilus asiaticus 5a2]
MKDDFVRFLQVRVYQRSDFCYLKLNIMKQIIFILIILSISIMSCSQPNSNLKINNKMKLNAGIITKKMSETKSFYTTLFNFGVTFENEFYLLLHTPNHESEISFLLPNHPSQQPLFHKPFQGQGVYLTIEVDDVDKVYNELKEKNIPIRIELRDEPWGDRHFAIEDPNGIGIDIVKYSPQQDQ